MTQTLMDFLGKVAPAHVPAIDEERHPKLRRAEAHYQARLFSLNTKIARLTHGGCLIGVPLCPSACRNGPLADFVLGLGTDPYRRWNIVLYADSRATAQALNTVPYRPDYDSDIDQTMVHFLNGLRRSRDRQISALPYPTPDAIADINDSLRTKLLADCTRIEATLFGARKRQWHLHSESHSDNATCEISPPSAVISAAISAGKGAENRISSPLTG